MAEVPLYSPQVTPDVRPAQNTQQPVEGAFAAKAAGETLGRASQVLEQRANIFEHHAQAMQEIANTAEVNQAHADYMTRLQELTRGPNGYNSLRGGNAVAAYPQIQESIRDAHDTAMAGLTNDFARRQFSQQSLPTTLQVMGDVADHLATENRSYVDGQHTALMAAATQNATLNYQNPEVFAQSMATIDAASAALARANGWSPDEANFHRLEARSDAISNIARSIAITDDPIRAQNFANTYASDLTPQARVGLAEYLSNAARPFLNQRGADGIIHGTATTSDPHTWYTTRIIHAEGGGAQGQNTSPMGASGQAQMMPGTQAMVEHAMGIGPQGRMNARVGEYYFSQMLLPQFGNNVIAATAAYNSNPTAVHDWMTGDNHQYMSPHEHRLMWTNPNHLALGAPTPGHELEWAARIPWTETRRYVTGIIQNGGAPSYVPAPTGDAVADGEHQLQAAQAQAQNMPEDQRASFIGTTQAQINQNIQMQHEHEAQVSDAVLAAAVGDGTHIGPRNLTGPGGILSDPQLRADYNSLPTRTQLQIQARITAFENQPTQARIQNASALQAGVLAGTATPNDINSADITISDQRSLLRLYNNRQARAAANENIRRAISIPAISGAMAEAGMHPRAGFDTVVGQGGRRISVPRTPQSITAYNQFTGALAGQIENFTATHHHPPSDAEITQMALPLFGMRQAASGQHADIQMGYNVPAADRALIVSALAAEGIYNPDEGTIAQRYFRVHGRVGPAGRVSGTVGR